MTDHNAPTQPQDDIIDIEQFAREGRTPPRCARYRIRIDREHFVVLEPCLTGRELLTLAGKCPPERYQVFQKLCGGRLQQIGLDEKADFTRLGVERFVTLPLDQREG